MLFRSLFVVSLWLCAVCGHMSPWEQQQQEKVLTQTLVTGDMPFLKRSVYSLWTECCLFFSFYVLVINRVRYISKSIWRSKNAGSLSITDVLLASVFDTPAYLREWCCAAASGVCCVWYKPGHQTIPCGTFCHRCVCTSVMQLMLHYQVNDCDWLITLLLLCSPLFLYLHIYYDAWHWRACACCCCCCCCCSPRECRHSIPQRRSRLGVLSRARPCLCYGTSLPLRFCCNCHFSPSPVSGIVIAIQHSTVQYSTVQRSTSHDITLTCPPIIPSHTIYDEMQYASAWTFLICFARHSLSS